ncbi:MAG: hypothetical protein LKF88_01715 [Microbacteriaceae bacterium]|nr:hypothetical protein [Microbacteriaceae bacterium]
MTEHSNRERAVLLQHVGSDLHVHESVYGPLRIPTAPVLKEELRQSGLTGRGGGGFPVWRKLQTVLDQPRRPEIIANASEGEPWSHKDRTLMRLAPHLILDGLSVLRTILKAKKLTLVAAARDVGTLRDALSARSGQPDVRILPSAGRYVGGEASAVAALVAGHPALPSDRTAPLAVNGNSGTPIFLSNVETIAEIALVARFGGAWFRSLGHDRAGGIRLVSVTGDVRHPEVREARSGVSLRELISHAEPSLPAAAILGGLGGSWVRAAHWDTPYTDAALANIGARPGTGIIHVVSAVHCPLRMTSRLLHRLAEESARQCGPCLYGLPALAASFDTLIQVGTSRAEERVNELAQNTTGRGICHHPDSAAALAHSALEIWRDHLQEHRRGRCDLR